MGRYETVIFNRVFHAGPQRSGQTPSNGRGFEGRKTSRNWPGLLAEVRAQIRRRARPGETRFCQAMAVLASAGRLGDRPGRGVTGAIALSQAEGRIK
jgi:hypothetical protein